MSEDEYDEELPPICVNTSTSSASALLMPSAEELASQRAREAECERELLSLRAQHEVAMLTDSSGSEGEAALAAAVNALAMPAATPPESAGGGGGAAPAPLPALLARLAPEAPALLRAPPDTLAALTEHVCVAVEADRVQSEHEVVLAAAWLCAVAAGAGGVGRAGGRGVTRRARRALHHLLDSDAFGDISEEAFQSLSKALVEMASPPHVRLEMADVLTCTPDGTASAPPECTPDGTASAPPECTPDGSASVQPECTPNGSASAPPGYRTRLVSALLWTTISATLGVSVPQNTDASSCACALVGGAGAGAGAGASAGAAGVGARAAGRLARRCRSPARCAAAAAALLAPPPARHRQLQPHELEMLVNASKLQLLFRE